MKLLIISLFCLISTFTQAQTAKELIGKWKLIKSTKDGIVTTPTETFQVFEENGVFNGINGKNSRKGKWKLTDDNSKLTIKVSIISITFNIDYFDSKKRIITSDKTGKLEYEKIE